MGPRTAISYSLLIWFFVDVGICLSSTEEKNIQSPGSTLSTDIATESTVKFNSSESKLSKRHRRVADKTYGEDEEDEDVDGAPPDHVVPYSEHEDPEEPSTKPNYTNPGDWAKPPPDRDIPLDFVPTKLYAQVRGTHTVKRVPREEALETAETAEELLSAPRLREVVSKSKKNTIYTEEGYEDSAYDHAGHVRDADFHEGFARKLNDKRKSKLNSKKKPINYEKEELKNEESTDEELNEYDDDDRDYVEESVKVENMKPLKRGKEKAKGEKYKSVNGIWQDPHINPKKVTENEIERLEENLKNEYAESEKNVEDQIPENLKNYQDEEDSNSEQDSRNDYDYGKQMDKSIAESREASREFVKNQSGERIKSVNNDYPVASSINSDKFRGSTSTTVNPTGIRRRTTKPASVYENTQSSENHPGEISSTSVHPSELQKYTNPDGFISYENSQSLPGVSSTTPDYGKVFWNYFKLVGDKWKPKQVSTPSDITTTTTEAVKLIPEEMTRVPVFSSVHTTLRDFDTFSFSPPTTELKDFVFAGSSMGPIFPRAASLYESWKRQDREAHSQESPEFGSLEAASNSYPMGFEATTKINEDSVRNTEHGDTTTLVTPKKLSYTVIIRSNDKTTTKSPPCDREIRKRPKETNSVELTSPRNPKIMKFLKDQLSPQEINNIAVKHKDFTVVQPPLQVPLRQVTYNDFLPDTYISPVRQSVTQESGQPGKKVNGGRDRYNVLESPYDKRFSNLFSHASEAPHFHHHRGHQSSSGPKRSYRHHPLTQLVPPSPMVRSNYAEYLGVNRPGNPRTRFNRSPGFDPWSDLFQLYQSIDRSIFGRRRRRSLSRERKNEEPRDVARRQYQRTVTSNDRGKVNYRSLNASAGKYLQPERNFFHGEANRLVALDAAGIVNLSGDENFHREKSSEIRKRRNHEDLLNTSPIIAEEEINAEIETRFKNEEEEEEGEEKYDNSEEKERGKVDVQVPEFDVSEVINSNKNEKIISNHPSKANKLDVEKYPFYENSRVPQSSPLKYITNPRQVPRKTLGGTEFYDSRDRYLECDEVEPNLESVVPEVEEPMPDREVRGDEPRLRGLGDKLDCFRAKYFDENPLDNPLFLEKQIDQPRAPKEFNPAKFASRIFDIPIENQEERDIIKRVSRKPETDLRRSGSKRNQVSQKDEQNSRTVNNKNQKREREQSTRNPKSRRKLPERRGQKQKIEQVSTEPPQHYPVTPYQRQVYEDVMGTIKNLAGMYQEYGESVPAVQSNVNYVPVDLSEKDWNFQGVRITEKPRNFLIHGLLPPQTRAASEHQPLQRYRVIPYRTNKVSYRMRARTENPPGSEGVKVGYFKTVRVHKRSIDNSEVSGDHDMDIGESRNLAVRGIKNSTSDTNLKKKILQDTEKEEKPAASERVVYTIRDRIRYSKPRNDYGKNGKFSNLEAAGTEDVRRQEPRYNPIKRRKVNTSSTTDPSNTTNEEQIQDVESTATALIPLTEQDKTKGRQDFHDEPGEIYKIQFSTTRGTQTAPIANRRRDDEDLADDEDYYEEEKELEESRNDKLRKNNYDVRENVEEDVTTVSNFNVEPTRAPEYYKLQDYLQSEPPGYSEAFTEITTEPTSRYRENKNKEDEEEEDLDNEDEERPNKSYQRAETRRDDEQEEKEDEEQGGNEQVERPESYADEESTARSEEAEDAPEIESYKNAEEDEEETKDDESSHDGEKEFHRFASRPYSPFESYEDPKYADLGPRLSKPSFYHPTFSKPTSSKNRRREYSAESDEGSDENDSEKTSRYIFPWEQDEAEGVEESKNSEHSIGRYEYPWERRERLAKERRRKEKAKKEYEKLFGYPYDPEDDEEAEEQNGSNTKLHGRRVYPWEQYNVPSKNRNRRKSSRNNKIIDNIEVGTEYRPVTKFSSRYKSRMFRLNDDTDPFFVSGADPSEIRVSVIESIKKASETPTVDPIKVLKNIVQVNGSTVATSTVANPYRISGGTNSTSKRLRNWKTPSISVISTDAPTTTIAPTRTGARPRSWRIASTTTKKPVRSRKRVLMNELLKSGSQTTEVTTTVPDRKNDSNASTITPLKTTPASLVVRKTRRRGQTIKTSHNSTATTVRPVRRRLSKSTVAPKSVEETTVTAVSERITTPKSKTVEHRSSFSKEEIITKTSYPRLVTDEDKEDGSNVSSKNERKGKLSKKSNNMMNESVKKVSIVTKETPEHIYRTEEVDKDGVKGMFVSITPNNETRSSLESMEGPEDRTINNDDTKEMLKIFEDFDDKDNEQEAGSSFMQDSHLMANLLRQVPPFMNDLTFDESFQEGGNNYLDTEGSGYAEGDEDVSGQSRHESRINYEKNPNKRLYYYVEK